jgi:hypothetical protein
MLPLLIHILILVLVVGFVLYILQLLPIDATMKQIAYAIILFVVLLYLLQLLLGGASGFSLGRLCP